MVLQLLFIDDGEEGEERRWGVCWFYFGEEDFMLELW